MTSKHSAERWPFLALLAGAVYFTVGVLYWRSVDPTAQGSNDTYMYAYPNLVHAVRSLRDGGWLWNPYQDCGQPFFAISQTGLLYPGNWIVALLPREIGLMLNIIVHLCLAGLATYRLAREIDLTPSAALCAALAFELGGSTLDLAAWSPIHIGAYAWMPVAMLCTERLVRRPGVHAAIVLGLVLTLQLLPGFPQILFFTYQLIALRVTWAVLTGGTPQPLLTIGSALGALVLPLGLAAVQLLPSLEVARESLRTIPLSTSEIGGFTWSWNAVRVLGAIDLFGLALAAVGVLTCRRVARATTTFYVLVVFLYCALSLGPGTPLFDLYARLPMGTAFRGSARLLWVVGFALAILVGIGAQAILELRQRGVSAALVAMIPVMLGAVLLHGFTAEGIRASEWGLAAMLIATAVAAAAWDMPAYAILPILVAVHGIVVVPKPFGGLRAGDVYGGHREVFERVRQRMTPQQRTLIFGKPGDYSLMPKSATLFAMPDIFDYEPQVSRTYAELFTYMRTGRGVQVLDDWYWIFKRLLPATTVQARLFNLMAPRYLILERSKDTLPPALTDKLELVEQHGDLRIYENASALPRTFYVPRVVVTPPEQMLSGLADGRIDPTRAIAVAAAPRSGFLGSDPSATGSAEFIENGAETVRLRVNASQPGFLFLADQYFPGWNVYVNGETRELLRANYTFRAVEVPAGESEVAFTYRPRALWIGGLVSLVSALVIAALWFSRRSVARPRAAYSS